MSNIGGFGFGLATIIGFAVFASPAAAQCAHCVIQTKVPSPSAPGRFDYRVSCIVDISGDEVNTVVTAATDEEAIDQVRKKGC